MKLILSSKLFNDRQMSNIQCSSGCSNTSLPRFELAFVSVQKETPPRYIGLKDHLQLYTQPHMDNQILPSRASYSCFQP